MFRVLTFAACLGMCAAHVITITSFPAPGTLNPIVGYVTGLPGLPPTPSNNPSTTYKLLLFLQSPDGSLYYSKLTNLPGESQPLPANGQFVIKNWALEFGSYVRVCLASCIHVLGPALLAA